VDIGYERRIRQPSEGNATDSPTESDFVGCSQFFSCTPERQIVLTRALVNGGFNIVSLLDTVAATKTGDTLVVRQEWKPRLRDVLGLPLAERQRNGHHVWDVEVPPWS
jgi:hypothetical protein